MDVFILPPYVLSKSLASTESMWPEVGKRKTNKQKTKTRLYHLPVPKDSFLFNNGLCLWKAIRATAVPAHVLTERQ